MVSSFIFLVSAVFAQDLATLSSRESVLSLGNSHSMLDAPKDMGTGPAAMAASAASEAGAANAPREARHLVILGAVLAAACVFSGVILGFLILASVAGLAMPLMGALPSTSAAFFAMEVLAAMGSTSIPISLQDLIIPLGWMYPAPDSMLVSCILVLALVWLARRTAVRLHRKHLGTNCVAQMPHGLSPGSWELRALGLLAFPLASASAQLVINLDQADSAVAGLVVSIVILCFLANQAALAFCFVQRVLEEGEVLRTAMPNSSCQEIFIDKISDEIRALPLSSSPPGQALMSQWLATAGWYVAPSVALIEETEWSDEAHATFRERMAHSSPDASDEPWQQAAEPSIVQACVLHLHLFSELSP